MFLDPYHHLSQAKHRADIMGHVLNETLSLGERLVLEGSPIQLLEVALSGKLVLTGP